MCVLISGDSPFIGFILGGKSIATWCSWFQGLTAEYNELGKTRKSSCYRRGGLRFQTHFFSLCVFGDMPAMLWRLWNKLQRIVKMFTLFVTNNLLEACHNHHENVSSKKWIILWSTFSWKHWTMVCAKFGKRAKFMFKKWIWIYVICEDHWVFHSFALMHLHY